MSRAGQRESWVAQEQGSAESPLTLAHTCKWGAVWEGSHFLTGAGLQASGA